ncbi:DL-endopeptidase inhibitor IseA family protein [Psychrobacillus sp.]|uniref:DL-endopeptidase inhibitor IseA family protein n=1 Tax=Psychrobacillus sp. TaxID=1871623 RepID=UPI0028BD4A2C|nr:DL-endopeptidase inhibitor IseA family protein [Psychrobacillus sp.]
MNKKFLIAGLSLALLGAPFSQSNTVLAKEQEKVGHTTKQNNELSSKQALSLTIEWNKAISYVQRGGDYKKGEYKTFSYNKKTYRYLSSQIDTKKELKAYLERFLTSSEAEQFIKNRGIIEYNGKLAQVEADIGSLLQWEKAAAKYIKAEKNTVSYRLTVPVWNTNEKKDFIVEYQYVKNVGWRISKEPTQEKSTVMTDKLAIELATKFAKATLHVQAGGDYGPGEYKTFPLNGYTYRFLSSKIDTKSKLMTYLTQSMTQSAAEQFIKDRGIIEYKGKLAQIDADGGSTAIWAKATAEFMKTDKNTMFYRVTVPFGETLEKQMYIVEYQYVDKVGWRISKEAYSDLEISSNTNPISILFNNLLSNSKVAQNQFLPYSSFYVDDFKNGVKKINIVQLTEIGRSSSQVEFLATIRVELESNYSGPLMYGENKMYFTVQPTGYMEFKIDQIGIVNMY